MGEHRQTWKALVYLVLHLKVKKEMLADVLEFLPWKELFLSLIVLYPFAEIQ